MGGGCWSWKLEAHAAMCTGDEENRHVLLANLNESFIEFYGH
jgi:hypothetical protein